VILVLVNHAPDDDNSDDYREANQDDDCEYFHGTLGAGVAAGRGLATMVVATAAAGTTSALDAACAPAGNRPLEPAASTTAAAVVPTACVPCENALPPAIVGPLWFMPMT
jgi:hypothetical protein